MKVSKTSLILFFLYSSLPIIKGTTQLANRYGDNQIQEREFQAPATIGQAIVGINAGIWGINQRISVLNMLIFALIGVLCLGLVFFFGFYIYFVLSLISLSPAVSISVATVVGVIIISIIYAGMVHFAANH